MSNVVTDRDMRDQVIRALGAFADEHDAEAIVRELQEHFGTVDTETIPTEDFWSVVERHAK